MDWDKLRVFHAAADAGSFTHAGERLGLSQSAVSRQVGALEQDLDTPLFHRHARGLILTEQGEILLRRGGEELDLHRTFVDGYYGLCVPVGELFDGGNGFVLGDREVTALPASARLVHACLSAAVADAQPRLAACRDIVQLMTMTDADEAVAVAERWKCTGPLAAGVLAATQLLPAPDLPLVRWAHQHPPRITTRTLIAIYRSGWRGPLGLASGLLAPLGVRGRVRYLRGIVRQSWVSWRSRPG